jgi:glycosyltransferase involved in cell wall biosynthesis
VATRDKGAERRTRRLFYACCEDLTQEAAWTVHIREVVNNWEKLGVPVTLFAPRIRPFSVPPVCDVVYVPTIDVRIVREYLYLVILPLYILLFGLRRRPDALYCREMNLMAPVVCVTRLLGIPVIMEINGFLLGNLRMVGASGLRLSIFRFFQMINLRLADSIVFAGKDYLDLFGREYDIEKEKARYVPNGVDTDLFSPGNRQEAARLIGLDPARRYVTFVGTFHPHSLTPLIIRAAERIIGRHDDIDFLMVGEGHDLALCRAMAREMGISDRVIFRGTQKNRDVPNYLRSSALLINLIEGSEDCGSMKLLEYMSSGGAVVVNKGSAFGISLTHRKDCCIIKETVPEALAEAIETLIGDDGTRQKMGMNARRLIIDHFSWKKTAEKLISVIDEAGNRH